ncbi:Eco47II family restriction endonuclease [Mycoplasmopsis columbinasalis]|uniref:Cytosine-specific DNA methyltransferase/Type II site-specific deoxyribonuclease n=1 Tax=Mycoplasmopsis columbinasalis TaxID=114880 RepID=A0A449B9Z6_9BACT|nr:Eco47II family restriction endonuclease [Mycoplasmopsis columbinasalis]VEU78022.1 Cytosine-specific DNA methyltransferase/Type II site-specific deoxyribonuclease [Mycoplasmopsis columbinasalis]
MWKLNFISEADLTSVVRTTIEKYGEKIKPFDLKLFKKNVIDPIKLIFDKQVYGYSWDELIENEIFRQKDKSNNNEIGYFHQNIFKYIKNCSVPGHGWDVIYKPETKIKVDDEFWIEKVYVELKNKHNTMNYSSASRTYLKMQNQLLLEDKNTFCFLVEIVAKKSQNVIWETKIEDIELKNNRIRRVSVDKFYEIITGQYDAFYQLCMVLPKIINKVLNETKLFSKGKDTVSDELFVGIDDDEIKLVALYMLSFDSYHGFKEEKIKK